MVVMPGLANVPGWRSCFSRFSAGPNFCAKKLKAIVVQLEEPNFAGDSVVQLNHQNVDVHVASAVQACHHKWRIALWNAYGLMNSRVSCSPQQQHFFCRKRTSMLASPCKTTSVLFTSFQWYLFKLYNIIKIMILNLKIIKYHKIF